MDLQERLREVTRLRSERHRGYMSAVDHAIREACVDVLSHRIVDGRPDEDGTASARRAWWSLKANQETGGLLAASEVMLRWDDERGWRLEFELGVDRALHHLPIRSQGGETVLVEPPIIAEGVALQLAFPTSPAPGPAVPVRSRHLDDPDFERALEELGAVST